MREQETSAHHRPAPALPSAGRVIVALGATAFCLLVPPPVRAQEPAPPPPEQPAWSGEAPDATTATDTPPAAPAANPEPRPPAARDVSVPSTSAPPSPPTGSSDTTFTPGPGESASTEVGVPNARNFSLPNFDAYGRPLFERQGLRFRLGPFQLRMSLTLGGEYNSNIFGSSQNVVADYIVHVTPGFLVGVGDFRDKVEDFLLLNYHPSLDYYQTLTDQNRVNQNLEITGQATLSRYSTTVDLGYQTSNLPNATQNGGQSYSNLNFNWDNRYYLGAKTFARAVVGATTQTSENNNNYQTFTLSPQVGYAYSPKTTVFFGPFVGISNIDQGGSQTFQGLSMGFTFNNLRKLQITGSFGVQARQFDNQNTTGAANFITPVFNFGFSYLVGPNTSVNLGLLRDVQLSDLQRGLTYTNSQINLGFSQTIIGRLRFGLDVTYQLLEYQGDAPVGRTDEYLAFGPKLEYSFWGDAWTVNIFYRQQNRSSDVELYTYEVTSYGINFSYRF